MILVRVPLFYDGIIILLSTVMTCIWLEDSLLHSLASGDDRLFRPLRRTDPRVESLDERRSHQIPSLGRRAPDSSMPQYSADQNGRQRRLTCTCLHTPHANTGSHVVTMRCFCRTGRNTTSTRHSCTLRSTQVFHQPVLLGMNERKNDTGELCVCIQWNGREYPPS